MDIGNRIKERRQELGMTQEELARRLNVSRSTVSNWEIGRNYPDIKLIIDISTILDISLDDLLKSSDDVVEKIAEDTNVRKKQSKKIKILYIILIALVVAIACSLVVKAATQDIRSVNQITSIEIEDNTLFVETDLPFYRSTGDYMISNSQKDPHAVEIDLVSRIDFSLKHIENVEIPLDSETFPEIETVHFIYDGTIIKSFDVK